MAEPGKYRSVDPKHALFVTRLLWAVLLLGQLILGLVVVLIVRRQQVQINPQIGQVLFIASIAALVLGMVIAYFIRMQVYKAHWEGDVIVPRGYVVGNLIFFAICEGIVFLSMVSTVFAGRLDQHLAPAAIALIVFLLNFPTGRPMQRDQAGLDDLTRP